jgi:hypothetical protein
VKLNRARHALDGRDELQRATDGAQVERRCDLGPPVDP